MREIVVRANEIRDPFLLPEHAGYRSYSNCAVKESPAGLVLVWSFSFRWRALPARARHLGVLIRADLTDSGGAASMRPQPMGEPSAAQGMPQRPRWGGVWAFHWHALSARARHLGVLIRADLTDSGGAASMRPQPMGEPSAAQGMPQRPRWGGAWVFHWRALPAVARHLRWCALPVHGTGLGARLREERAQDRHIGDGQVTSRCQTQQAGQRVQVAFEHAQRVGEC